MWRQAFAEAAERPACAKAPGSVSPGDESGSCAVLDVGAAYGYYSLLTALHAPAGVRAHAFNPHPAFMHELRRNLMLNRVDGRVCLHEYGVSEAPGNATMEYSVCGKIWGGSCIHEHGGTSTLRQVRVTTLDEWAASSAPALLRRRAPFLFVKLDIEGAGAMAIRGGRRLLHHATHVLVGIHNPDEWKEAHATFRPPVWEVLMARQKGGAHDPNGVFAARRARNGSHADTRQN